MRSTGSTSSAILSGAWRAWDCTSTFANSPCQDERSGGDFQRSCYAPWDTTTHENDFSLPCPHQQGSTHSTEAGSEVVFYLVPRACRVVGPRYPKAPPPVASFRPEAEHATETLSRWISHQPAAYERCVMDVVF